MAKPKATQIVDKRDPTVFRKGAYKGITMEQVASRPNSLNVLKMPSRFGNNLHYPTGDTAKTTKE